MCATSTYQVDPICGFVHCPVARLIVLVIDIVLLTRRSCSYLNTTVFTVNVAAFTLNSISMKKVAGYHCAAAVVFVCCHVGRSCVSAQS
jgi:hypothetical protein